MLGGVQQRPQHSTDTKPREISMRSQSQSRLNSNYLWFVSRQGASLDPGTHVIWFDWVCKGSRWIHYGARSVSYITGSYNLTNMLTCDFDEACPLSFYYSQSNREPFLFLAPPNPYNLIGQNPQGEEARPAWRTLIYPWYQVQHRSKLVHGSFSICNRIPATVHLRH